MRKLATPALTLVSLLFSLLMAELLLVWINKPPLHGYYTAALKEFDAQRWAKWWRYDADSGVHFDADQLSEPLLAALEEMTPNWRRLRVVNEEGYHDSDPFRREPHVSQSVLVLGDSFAWGASAPMGRSFVELFEQAVRGRDPAARVWNAAVPGTGTEQALLTARRWLPVLQPDVVLLALYENDLQDNLYPVDRYLRTEAGVAISRYRYDRSAEAAKPLSADEIREQLTRRISAQETHWSDRWRVARVAKQAFATQQTASSRTVPGAARDATFSHLSALQQVISSSEWGNPHLLVLLIPSRATVGGKPTPQYESLRELSLRSGLPILELVDQLETSDYAALPDNHWNERGHGVATRRLIEGLIGVDDRLRGSTGPQ